MKDTRTAEEFAKDLQRQLDEQMTNYPILVFDSIDSTHLYAKGLAKEGADRAVIVAFEQTAGRGRMGRSFYSPADSGVYFSLLHAVDLPLADVVSVTAAASVAVMRAIRRVCDLQTEIKWVNDLYYRGKKVCGILAEAVRDPSALTQHALIIGVGINLYRTAFPAELADVAGSLDADGADACSLIAAVVDELSTIFDDLSRREWLDDYRKHSCVIGKAIKWMRGNSIGYGKAIDIDDNGGLILLDDTGERLVLSSGEISVRLC